MKDVSQKMTNKRLTDMYMSLAKAKFKAGFKQCLKLLYKSNKPQ